jgi:hypothetical protein
MAKEMEAVEAMLKGMNLSVAERKGIKVGVESLSAGREVGAGGREGLGEAVGECRWPWASFGSDLVPH